jgi:hypothetical protein
MDEVISSFTTALDELYTLTYASYHTAMGEDAYRVDQIIDDVLSFLINAYSLGTQNAALMLDYDIPVNVSLMEDAIYFMIDGKTFADRVADHVTANDLAGLQVLVESEYHRVYNAAVQNGATEYVSNGAFGVTKTWHTIRDDKVRETHRYLENQSIPVEEEFFTFDGDHASYPGGFSRAENNVNCRCIVTLTHDE